MDSAVLEDIKARLWSRDGQVTLKLADKEDESKKGSRIDGENDGDEEDKSRKGSRIDRENNSNEKDESREGSKINEENNSKNEDD